MKRCASGCFALLVVASAAAEEPALVIDVLAGHAVHHAAAAEAGVVKAIRIEPGTTTIDLEGLCDELRVAAGLASELAADLPLRVVFIVPWKAMAVEGYYLPVDGTAGLERLLPGDMVVRSVLDSIVARAGLPPWLLDENGVEHEMSCELDRPAWMLRWDDVRGLDGEAPEVVIARALDRFAVVHRTVVEHAARLVQPTKM